MRPGLCFILWIAVFAVRWTGGPAIAVLAADPPTEPKLVPSGPKVRPVALPDGSFRSFFVDRRGGRVVSVTSTDGGATWSEPRFELRLPNDRMGGGLALLDSEGETHLILTHVRGEGRPAVSRFIDLWHCRTTEEGRTWTEPKLIWEGYCGAVMDVKQLRSGRVVVPFAAWKKPGEEVAPSTGSNYTTCLYSDDGGDTWALSPAKLTAPCYEGYNGNNYGAIEPTIVELKDGRVWMLLRTQTGFLYESFSEDGVCWSEARPSPFRSSTSPAALERLPDGRIVVFWNNCEIPLRHEGAGVYGGRDALHVAISSDEGKTWKGFREVYRDPYRNETPPRRGDRGTAYPGAAAGKDDRIILVAGQGNRRTTILIDPGWITGRRQYEDFSEGLDRWHVWKEFGPATGFWRDRTQGPRLIEPAGRGGPRALHIRRPDENDADCASWNFPGGATGTLSLRLVLREGFRGASVSLGDRFFNPGDDRGETEAVFHLPVRTDGTWAGAGRLPMDRSVNLTFRWNLSERQCDVLLDGESAAVLPIRNEAPHGISYLRLRSTAQNVDHAGFLVELVEVETSDP
jgi:hypothetical protein